jgi:hypothetical protein
MFRRLMMAMIAIGFIGILGLTPVRGQAATGEPVGLDSTYVSVDGAFRFDYPSAYSLTITEDYNNPDVGIFYLAENPIWLEVVLPEGARRYERRALGGTPEEIVIAKIEQWEANAPVMMANMVSAGASPEFEHKNAPLTPFDVNGNQGVYGLQVYRVDDQLAAAVMVVTVDLGDGYVVTVAASAQLDNGAAILEQNLEAVLAVVGTMQYVAPEIAPPQLGKLFTGPVGIWQFGTLTFAYPDDWYAVTLVGNLFLANTAEMTLGADMVPGQMIVRFVAPDFNMTVFESEENIRGCSINGEAITPMAVINTQMLGDAEAALVAQGVLYTEPRPVALNNHLAAEMWLFTEDHDMMVLAVDMGGGNVVSMTVFAYPGEMELYEDVLMFIADSLTYTPDGCQ